MMRPHGKRMQAPTHVEHCICYGFLERRIGGEDGDRDSGAKAGRRASYELFSGAMRCWAAFARWSLYVCMGIVAYSIVMGLAGGGGGVPEQTKGRQLKRANCFGPWWAQRWEWRGGLRLWFWEFGQWGSAAVLG